MIGWLQINIGTDVIGYRISQLFWRIADLDNMQALNLSERTIVALAIFACCMGLVRCIRTAIR